jgi:hypothetical protein
MRNSAPHDIGLCKTISTEFKYRSTCLIFWFNFGSRSTYLIWILFQFRQSERIRFIIIQRLFAHNDVNHRSELPILYARKNSVKEISLGPRSGWAKVESGRAGSRNTRATFLWPVSSTGERRPEKRRRTTRHLCLIIHGICAWGKILRYNV